MASKLASNTEIAEMLGRIADLLKAKGDNPFRINSYRRVASLVKNSDRSFARLAQEQGVVGLGQVRGIGEKLAGVIEEYVSTNKVGLLEELEKVAPLPVPKGGKTRRATPPAVQRRDSAADSWDPKSLPPVTLVLDVDAEYRRKADEGLLKVIAPRQHNPEGVAWLPILSTSRGDWKFTAMFSNTSLAHQLGKTADWVVIFFKKKGEEERQCTVVTENRGELKGRRVVRGREAES
jgi:DNA polymerase (family X)